MARRRFYAPANSFDVKHGSALLSIEETRHLRDVLRLSIGDTAFVFDGDGHEYESVVVEIGRDSARLNIVSEVSPARPESPLQLTLALALLKGEKFDLAVQKTTELGVTLIQPIITKLADIRLKDGYDAERRVARWQRIALEAAKQCGRASVPTVSAPTNFSSLIENEPNQPRLMFSERLGESFDKAIGELPGQVTAIVGSEGGWTDDEIVRARESGCKIVTLGGRVLRAETAAIALTALLQYRLGDLK
jgi:16S rRNA (uracil1498-N3)-methyltransferase